MRRTITSPPAPTSAATSALATLIILQAVMLAALYAQIAPHPPAVVTPFAIAPFLAVALSVATCAILMGSNTTGIGRAFSLLAGLLALVSYGPQKYFDAAFPLIWPAVIAAQIAIITLIVLCLRKS